MNENKSFFKELISQIMEILLVLLIITIIGLYLFYPEMFKELLKAMGVLVPIGIFIALYGMVTAQKIKKRKKLLEEGGGESGECYPIYVTKNDEMKNDALALVSAILIIVIAKVIEGEFNYADIWQAGLTVIAIYLTKKIYFKKQFSWS